MRDGSAGVGGPQHPFHLPSHLFLLTREQLDGAQSTLTFLPSGEIIIMQKAWFCMFSFTKKGFLTQTQEQLFFRVVSLTGIHTMTS